MFEKTRLSAAVIAVGLAWACGGGGDAGAGGEAAAGAAEEAAMPVVDPATAGAITGVIAFEGEAPAAQPIDMAEEPTCADAYSGEGPMTEGVLVSGGGLANVFVYVKEGLGMSFPAPPAPVVLDQHNCRYHPHILGLQVGQPLEIRNSDAVLHNINTQPTVNRGFNISQPQQGMETTRDFSMAEVMIPVKCDVHGWMHAYIGVLDHPYFAVSAADGSFSLPNLPPGDYVVEAWHETYGAQSMNVTVGESATAEVSFSYNAAMAGNVVPLGDPLIIGHGADGSVTADRRPAGD